jgi:hypothetical protein
MWRAFDSMEGTYFGMLQLQVPCFLVVLLSPTENGRR